MNLIQALTGLARREERPLHVGEVMSMWKVSAAFEDGRTIILGLLNHTKDPELKRFMESYISDFEEPWHKRLNQFMRDQGIPLPPSATDKAKTDAESVPPGARFTEDEIATMIAAKLLVGIQAGQEGILQCLRYDVGTMLLEMEAAAYRQSFVLREIMEKRGWLKFPPTWSGSRASH